MTDARFNVQMLRSGPRPGGSPRNTRPRSMSGSYGASGRERHPSVRLPGHRREATPHDRRPRRPQPRCGFRLAAQARLTGNALRWPSRRAANSKGRPEGNAAHRPDPKPSMRRVDSLISRPSLKRSNLLLPPIFRPPRPPPDLAAPAGTAIPHASHTSPKLQLVSFHLEGFDRHVLTHGLQEHNTLFITARG